MLYLIHAKINFIKFTYMLYTVKERVLSGVIGRKVGYVRSFTGFRTSLLVLIPRSMRIPYEDS